MTLRQRIELALRRGARTAAAVLSCCLVQLCTGIAQDLSKDQAAESSARATPPAVLHGRITDANGHAVRGAFVQLEQQGVLLLGTTTDTAGAYELSLVPNDEPYDLQAFLGHQGNWRLGLRLNAGARQPVDFALGADSISGKVVALDSTPLASVVVQAIWFGPNPAPANRQVQHSATRDRLRPGLWGEYFNAGARLRDFPSVSSVPSIARVDSALDFTSNFGSPLLDENFYARWTGKIRIPKAGAYTFYLRSDDGSRLFVDGALVVDNGGLHAVQEISGTQPLDEGDHDLKVEFINGPYGGSCQLFWAGENLAKQIVPSEALFHTEPNEIEPRLVPLSAAVAGAVGTNSVMTGAEGQFKFLHLKPGWYQIRACLANEYAYYRQERVRDEFVTTGVSHAAARV